MGKKGFTLLELIVVVIIIGILASIGLPMYFTVVEKARLAEGLSILGSLRSAQIRYQPTDPDGWYTDNIEKLGVSFTTSSDPTKTKYFNISFPDPHGDDDRSCAYVNRNNLDLPPGWSYPAYSLCITPNGTVYCSEYGVGYCQKLGYQSASCP